MGVLYAINRNQWVITFMNIEKLFYLNAMDIQTWQLKNHPVAEPDPANSGFELLFVGESLNETAGQLFTAMLDSIGFNYNTVSILTLSTPDLEKQIESLKPKLLIALGDTAANLLLGSMTTLDSFRGRIHLYLDTPLIVTYHPADLLRNPKNKRLAFQDLQLIKQTL